MARARDFVQKPAVNKQGVVHLHINGSLPEAQELAAMSGGLHGFNPAVSTAQRRLMAIGEHHPDALYAKHRGVARMTHQELHDFASTSERGLSEHVKPKKGKP